MADYKAMMAKGVSTINQIAESLAGSEYWAKVAPGLKQIQKEAGENIIKHNGVAATFAEESVNGASIMMSKLYYKAQGMQVDESEVQALASKIAGTLKTEADVDKWFGNNASIFGNRDVSGPMNSVKKMLTSGGAAVEHTPEQAYKDANVLTKLKEVPKAYFTNPDKDIRNTRIKTAVAGYATVSVGGRVLSGGSLTKDSYGRNDIAGVPFI